ncbi:MAG: threonine/serine dehydratase [Mycobacteriales bacterium]
MSEAGLGLGEIRQTAGAIQEYVVRTPVCAWPGAAIVSGSGRLIEPVLKLELFQRTGTFKLRGALANMLRLSPEERRRGVTTVSAGNHAIAVSYAASVLGISAKVVMLSSASRIRVTAASAHGAEVLTAESGPAGFELVNRIAHQEGRILIHPFEGRYTALGTATVGLEFAEQAPGLDALVVAIGGGGLAAGVASAFKWLQPECRIYGVEPVGADTMHRSFAAGAPQRIEHVSTIADSLAPPMALPFSFELCRAHVDELVRVDDDQICRAMALLFREMKLAVEPAGAAAMAAAVEPLSDRLQGKRVGVVLCGSNIDVESFSSYVRRGNAVP